VFYCCAWCFRIVRRSRRRWPPPSAASGADITSVDVIERGAHHAVDDLVVELAAGPVCRLADNGGGFGAGRRGRVDSALRRDDRPARELEVLDRLAGGADDPLQVLADGVTRIFRAGWSIGARRPDR